MIACVLTLLPAFAFSQKASSPPDRQHRMWADLELNEEQKEKLKTLHVETKTERKSHFEALRDLRTKIKDELLKEQPSQSVLDDYAQKMGALHQEMARKQNQHMLKLKEVLTAEQFSKIVSKEWKGGKHAGMKKAGCEFVGKPDCPKGKPGMIE